MQPDRFALDLFLKGPFPLRPTALYSDVWRYLDPNSPLHGRPSQRLAFGLLFPNRSTVPPLPRLRIYSTDEAFSTALATRLLSEKTIVIGRRPYAITRYAAVLALDSDLIDLQTPIVLRYLPVSDDGHVSSAKRCLHPDDPRFLERLQLVMKRKLMECGITEEELPNGPLLEPLQHESGMIQVKDRPIRLYGAKGRWRLYGDPDVRQCMLLSGLGTKTGLGCGFAVPA
jgi:CRISPR/Cas system endoribonuclease Cas6 (RAMP superfamily)